MREEYTNSGVNVPEADRGISHIATSVKSTWLQHGLGAVKLDIGFFANVIDLGNGTGMVCTIDGVGSKAMIADLAGVWTTIGIDCVAASVNDLLCVGARPLTMVDYIAVEYADAAVLQEIGVGLAEGARIAGISICGGEISQLPDQINGFDLVGAGYGIVDLDRMIVGEHVEPGDVIIGLKSSGIHANGLSLARRVLFNERRYGIDSFRSKSGKTLANDLLTPTTIYVKPILSLIDALPVKALVNITGDGLLNLNRIKRNDVGFQIDVLPEPDSIFNLIQDNGEIDDATMYQTFNMSVGFCVIVAEDYTNQVLSILSSHGTSAFVMGTVIADPKRPVYLLPKNLVGYNKTFQQI